MSSPLDALDRSLAVTGRLIERINENDWGSPTPCTEWTLRELVEHLIGSLDRFASALGAPAGSGDGGRPADAYRSLADRVGTAFGAPGALQREVDVPIGTVPAAMALQLLSVEVVTHGWDIARTIGQEAAFDDDDVETLIAFSQAALDQIPPDRKPFQSPRQVADSAPAADRLAALLGRDVARWTR